MQLGQWSTVSQNADSCVFYLHGVYNVFGRPVHPGQSAGLHQGDQAPYGARTESACCSGKQTTCHCQRETGAAKVSATCNPNTSPMSLSLLWKHWLVQHYYFLHSKPHRIFFKEEKKRSHIVVSICEEWSMYFYYITLSNPPMYFFFIASSSPPPSTYTHNSFFLFFLCRWVTGAIAMLVSHNSYQIIFKARVNVLYKKTYPYM